MTKAEERLMEWLNDAHAMEKQAELMLTGQARRLTSYPMLRERIDEHARETRGQSQRLERCIKRLGGGPSVLKDVAAQMVAMGQGIAGIFAGDEVMKGALANFTFENMEIASYRMLIIAAEEVGDMETAEVCRQNLEEEEAMASWLSENLEPLTKEYLSREELEPARAAN